MANGTLVKTFDIPANVRKQYARFTSLELYTDRLVGKGSKLGDVNFFFKNYMTIRWTPANLGTQFAQLVFITHENASNVISVNNLQMLNDVNRIPFCSGMFSYATANEYVKGIYADIIKVFDEYKAKDSNADVQPVQQVSAADELKKFKELLDSGVITQEEFDAKKKQLLGL